MIVFFFWGGKFLKKGSFWTYLLIGRSIFDNYFFRPMVLSEISSKTMELGKKRDDFQNHLQESPKKLNIFEVENTLTTPFFSLPRIRVSLPSFSAEIALRDAFKNMFFST